MKKINLIFTITSLLSMSSQFNLKKENIIKEETSTIIQQIVKEFESNDSIKISYFNLLKAINKNNYFNIINKNSIPMTPISFKNFFFNEIDKDTKYNTINFIYKNTNYYLKKDCNFHTDIFDQFENIFINNEIDTIEDTINNILIIASISELAHYYSTNNNIENLIKTIELIKNFIEFLNQQTNLNKDGKFLKEIQSWNLDEILNNYKNKIFNDKLNIFRVIDFDSISFDNEANVDFDYIEFCLCNQFKTSGIHPSTFDQKIKGFFSAYLNISFKSKNKTMFKIVQEEKMNVDIWDSSHAPMSAVRFGDFFFPDFSDSDIWLN